MITEVEKIIREYIANVIHLSLATSENNKPWVCEVHYVFDDDLHFYFRSKSSTRHCQEIACNPFVAGSIIKQHKNGEKVRGVYFEGEAELLTDVDKGHIAYKKYCDRFGTGESILDEAKTEGGHKFYKITVNKFYLFDSVDSNPAQKYELSWNI